MVVVKLSDLLKVIKTESVLNNSLRS